MYGLKFGVVKFNVNENLFGLSLKVLDVIVKVLVEGGVYYVYFVVMMLLDMIVECYGIIWKYIFLSVGLSFIFFYVVFVVSKNGKILGLDFFWDIMFKVFEK